MEESWFEVTPQDLQQAQIAKKALKKDMAYKYQVMPREMREKERIERLAKFKKCTIRIRFPDRIELECVFLPEEKLDRLFEFVASCLLIPVTKFYLFTTPPRSLLDKDCQLNFRDLGYLPATLVHFGFEEGDQISTSRLVKPEVLKVVVPKTQINQNTES